MSTYGPVPIQGEQWGIDTFMAGALTDAQLEKMLSTPMPNNQKCEVLCGYVPLPGMGISRYDMSRDRLFRAMDIGWRVWLVQHCRKGFWVASEEQGKDDGVYAAEYSKNIGYDEGCHLGPDLESVANTGVPVFSSMTSWARAWPTTMLYEGFDPGLSPVQLYDIPDIKAYWGAYGPWNVAKRGVCVRQGLQFMHCGVPVDPDHIAPDNLGGTLIAMGKLS